MTKKQNDLGAQQRLRSARVSAPSDEFLLSTWRYRFLATLKVQSMHGKDWPDRMALQADLSLRVVYMWFCQAQTQQSQKSTNFTLNNKNNYSIVIIFILHKMSRNMTNQENEYAPSKDSDQPGHPPSPIRVFAVCMKKAWVHSYPLSEDSDQTGQMPRLIWVFTWHTTTLLVLSCRGSNKVTWTRPLVFSLPCESYGSFQG